jgi:pimeloyl-ACP methyl ester carboxylesterase
MTTGGMATVGNYAAVLRTAGLQLPVPLLLLHGWSPGPGLPTCLLASQLFRVHEIEASTVLTIATNRYALAMIATTLATLGALLSVSLPWYAWAVLLPVVALGLRRLKQLAVARCLDDDMAQAAHAIERLQPEVLVGYSWGGGIATLCLERGVWRGPTLLLAPAGTMLNAHAGRAAPSLAACLSRADALPAVTICHGDQDAIVGVDDSVALARTTDPDRCSLVRGMDDHFLWRLAGNPSPSRDASNVPLVSWLVEMLVSAARPAVSKPRP